MKLTDRDKKLLLDIQDYGLLPTKLLRSRHFDGIDSSTVLKRLRLLEKGNFLQRISGLENGSHAWCLMPKVSEELFGLPAKTSYPNQIVAHDLNLLKLRLRLEEVGIAQAWIPEHVIRKRMAESIPQRSFRCVNIPDGLMGVETVHSHKMAYAIELEMTAKSQSRYREIFHQYQRRMDLKGYWYVVERATIGNQLMKVARRYSFGSSSPFFLWSLFDEVLSDPIKAMVHWHGGELSLGEMFKQGGFATHTPTQAMGN